MKIRKEVLGETHPDTAITYNNLADLYLKQKQYKNAISYYLKAYNVFLSVLGSSHSYTQADYTNMKHAYYQSNPDGNFERWLEKEMKKEAFR